MLASVLLALLLAAPADETVPVQRTTRLDVQTPASAVDVTVWNRDAVRVEADPINSPNVQVRTTANSVLVRTSETNGRQPSRITLTVPSWMTVRVLARRGDVTLTGVGGEVAVETISGNILVRGGVGRVYAKSLQGSVAVENAKATIEAKTVNSRVRVTDATGNVEASSTNGSVTLERVTAMKVDAGTVNGAVSFEGTLNDAGQYEFSTHNGGVSLVIPETSNATMHVKTYHGTFRSTFPVRLDSSGQHGDPSTLTIGSGAARVEIDAFNGSISLRRPEDPRPETRTGPSERSRSRTEERSRSRSTDKNKDKQKE